MTAITILLGYLAIFLAFKYHRKWKESTPRIEQEYRSGTTLATTVWHRGNIIHSSYLYNMQDQPNKLELERLEKAKAECFITTYRELEIGKE